MKDSALSTLTEIYEDARASAVFNDEEQDKLVVQQDFVVVKDTLYSMCSSNEWNLVGKITISLKKGNCLFYLSDTYKKSSSSIQRAIASLKTKKIIYKTEITNIYLANPIWIRRGTILGTLLTTIKVLENEGVCKEAIVDRKQVKIEKREMKIAG